MSTLKIMSFNTQHCMNYITREIDFEIMAETIRSSGADVVILNEMRGEGEREGFTDQTKILAELCGMPYYYFAKAIDVGSTPAPYGNAIMSKLPIDSAETVHIPDPPVESRIGSRWYEHRCIVKASVGALTFLGVHVGLNPDEQEIAIKTLCDNIPKEKCLLLGDFNMTPENERLLPIKERMRDTADLFTEQKLSIPSDAPTRKIDFIFATRDIEVVSADIPNVVASDHRPHIAEIKGDFLI